MAYVCFLSFSGSSRMDEAAKGQEQKQKQEQQREEEDDVVGQGEQQGEGSRPQTPDSDDSDDSFHTTSGEDPSTNMAGCGSCCALMSYCLNQ